MMISPSLHKPRLRKCAGIWFCSDGGGFSGQGATPKDAFRAYTRTKVAMDKWNEPDPHKYGNAAPGYDWNQSSYRNGWHG